MTTDSRRAARSDDVSVKRWCGSAAAGTETAHMNRMVEWFPDGGDDQQTPYVLAVDFDAKDAECARLAGELAAVKHSIGILTAQSLRHIGEREPLREALSDVRLWILNWDPQFVQDPEWPATSAKIDAALAPVPQGKDEGEKGAKP